MDKGQLAPGEFLAIYSKGLLYVSICTNIEGKSRIAEILNHKHPTGIQSQWDFSTDPTFSDGEPNPSPCNKGSPDNIHYLMSC